MKRQVVRFLLVTGCVASLSAGCAKKEMVQGTEPLAPSAAEPAAAGAMLPDSALPNEAAAATQGSEVSRRQEAAAATLPDPVPAAELAAALETIYFDFDRYTLSPEARESLTKSARLLAGKGAKLQIAGHCDERGSDDYNLALSERRAVAARDYLVALGVPQERISVIGYGKEKPAVTGHDERAWAQNRRDEFMLVEK